MDPGVVRPFPAFLAPDSAVARLIAERDWSGTLLGPIQAWPPALTHSLALMLRSNVPMALRWGEAGVLLYNDGYAAFAGRRHPDILGLSVRDAWPETRAFNEQILAAGLRGERLSFTDQPFDLDRDGAPARAWLDLDYSPVVDETGAPVGVLAIVVETTAQVEERRRAAALQQARQQSEEWLRLALVAGGFSDWYWDAGTDRVRFSSHAAKQLGIPAGYQPTSGEVAALIPGDARAEVIAARRRAFETGEAYSIEYPLRRPDGGIGWIVTFGQPVSDETGKVIGVIGISHDISERKAAEDALRNSEESLRLATEGAGMATWDLDLATMTGRWSGTRFALFGLPRPPGDIAGVEEWFERIHPEDVGAVRPAIERCFADGDPFHAEYRIRRADTGEERWLQSHGNRIAPGSGKGWRAVGVSVDITQQKQWERRQRLLVNELNHRVKNILAIIQAIAHQSFRAGVDQATARASFESRLTALSSAHDLLTEENWEGASLRQVVAASLAAVPQPERIAIHGPDLALTPKTAVSLAMALHELATNAMKYGALSNDSGTISIRWSIARERLHLKWREAGGPPVAPPSGRGFGSRMIERGLAAELTGKVAIDFAPTGLVCTVDAPLPASGEA